MGEEGFFRLRRLANGGKITSGNIDWSQMNKDFLSLAYTASNTSSAYINWGRQAGKQSLYSQWFGNNYPTDDQIKQELIDDLCVLWSRQPNKFSYSMGDGREFRKIHKRSTYELITRTGQALHLEVSIEFLNSRTKGVRGMLTTAERNERLSKIKQAPSKFREFKPRGLTGVR